MLLVMFACDSAEDRDNQALERDQTRMSRVNTSKDYIVFPVSNRTPDNIQAIVDWFCKRGYRPVSMVGGKYVRTMVIFEKGNG